MTHATVDSPAGIGQAEQESGPRCSRRGLLASAAGLAAFWKGAAAQTVPPHEVSADVDPGALLHKLIARITYGANDQERALAQSLGYSGYLEYHLNHLAIDDSAADALLAPLTTLTMIPQQLYPLQAGQVVGELSQAVLIRQVRSNRQLFERMVEFWTDHFNIDINNGDDRWLKTVDDREAIRPFALDTFPNILNASAHSPAMLLYLDNNTSIAGNPNENYSRELLELHAMGVDGGYTQQDVHEVSRCFTGWGLYGRGSGALAGTFRYNAGQHDNGQKVVLGNVIPAGGGINDGMMVLNILANHPSTARFISTKLAKWLLGEHVRQSVIDRVTATYTSTGGNIKSMIRTALSANVLHDAEPRFTRPGHQFAAALRALPSTVTATGWNTLRNQLLAAGHHPYYWGPPDGYPDTFEYWSGGVLSRWNFGASLMNNNLSGVTVDITAFFSGLTTAEQMANRIDQALFSGLMPALQKQRVQAYLATNPGNTTVRREAVGLAIGAPAHLWY